MRLVHFMSFFAATVAVISSVTLATANPARKVDQISDAFKGTQRAVQANTHGASQAAASLNRSTNRSIGNQFNQASSHTRTNTGVNAWNSGTSSNSAASLTRRTPKIMDDTAARQQREAAQRQQDAVRRQQVEAQQQRAQRDQQQTARRNHQARLDQEKRRQELLAKFDQKAPVLNQGFQGKSTNQTLRPGTVIDRYGHEGGRYVSPAGTTKDARSLNRSPERPAYSMYVVQKPIPSTQTGTAAAARAQNGGGTQMILPKKVHVHLDDKSIRVANPTDANYAKNNFNGNAQP